MDGETPTKQSRRFYRILEAYAYLLLCAALGLFVLTYGVEGGTSSRPFEFYRTFFVFFLLFALMQALLTHTENLLGVLLLCFLSLMALLVLDYSLNDFLTIRLFLFLAFQAVVLVKIPHPFAFAPLPFLLCSLSPCSSCRHFWVRMT